MAAKSGDAALDIGACTVFAGAGGEADDAGDGLAGCGVLEGVLAGLCGFAGGVGDRAVRGAVGLCESAGEGEGGGEFGGGEEVVERWVFQRNVVVGCRGWGLGCGLVWGGGSGNKGVFFFSRGGGSGRRRRREAGVERFDKRCSDAADGVAVGFGSFLTEDFLTAYVCQAARSRLLFGVWVLVA